LLFIFHLRRIHNPIIRLKTGSIQLLGLKLQDLLPFNLSGVRSLHRLLARYVIYSELSRHFRANVKRLLGPMLSRFGLGIAVLLAKFLEVLVIHVLIVGRQSSVSLASVGGSAAILDGIAWQVVIFA